MHAWRLSSEPHIWLINSCSFASQVQSCSLGGCFDRCMLCRWCGDCLLIGRLDFELGMFGKFCERRRVAGKWHVLRCAAQSIHAPSAPVCNEQRLPAPGFVRDFALFTSLSSIASTCNMTIDACLLLTFTAVWPNY
eukprot:1239383-Pleurochrysis_carterae.AAC.2